MKLFLSEQEIASFRYIIPIQGNLNSLIVFRNILEKADSSNKESDYSGIEFSDIEIDYLKRYIGALDKANQLNLEALPLIEKIIKSETGEE